MNERNVAVEPLIVRQCGVGTVAHGKLSHTCSEGCSVNDACELALKLVEMLCKSVLCASALLVTVKDFVAKGQERLEQESLLTCGLHRCDSLFCVLLFRSLVHSTSNVM